MSVRYRYEKQWIKKFYWKVSKNDFDIDILPVIKISKNNNVMNDGPMFNIRIGWLCFHFIAWQCIVQEAY